MASQVFTGSTPVMYIEESWEGVKEGKRKLRISAMLILEAGLLEFYNSDFIPTLLPSHIIKQVRKVGKERLRVTIPETRVQTPVA